MPYQDNQILRCGQCNKPFDKEATLKRHTYYCRSRKSHVAPPRVRSCMACAKSKQRCDARKPQCSRCASRDVTCNYPQGSRSRKDPSSVAFTGEAEQYLQPSADLEIDWASTTNEIHNIEGFFPDDLGTIDINSMDAEIDYQDLTSLNLDLMVPPSATADKKLFPDFLIPWDLRTEDPMLPIPYQQTQQWQQRQRFSIPPTPTTLTHQIAKRPTLSPSTQRTASLIRSILRSYPLMMQRANGNSRTNSLPPFIHPVLLQSPPDGAPASTEALSTCMSLVGILHDARNPSDSNSSSRKTLFWRNVRWECERLRAEHKSMSAWTLLTSMQALLVYLLIRLDEDDNTAVTGTLDTLLVHTVVALSQAFASASRQFYASALLEGEAEAERASKLLSGSTSTISTAPCHTISSETRSWHRWLFQESARRLCTVYQIVNFIVTFSPAGRCDLPSQLMLAPLPGGKELWETRSADDWMDTRRGNRNGESDYVEVRFGMTRAGGLVKIESRVSGEASLRDGSETLVFDNDDGLRWREAQWDEWCVSMDGFGSLVLLAADLMS